MTKEQKMQYAGRLVLRTSLALVFLWFGTQQLLHADSWTGFVPDWATFSSLNATKLVMINGLFEVITAALLICNICVRPVALLLALHLFGITLSIGFTAIGVRDFGLSFATFALFLIGS